MKQTDRRRASITTFAHNIKLLLLFNANVRARVCAHSSQDLSIEPSINEHPRYWHRQKKKGKCSIQRKRVRGKTVVDKSMPN
jgi:hypothetical protein